MTLWLSDAFHLAPCSRLSVGRASKEVCDMGELPQHAHLALQALLPHSAKAARARFHANCTHCESSACNSVLKPFSREGNDSGEE